MAGATVLHIEQMEHLAETKLNSIFSRFKRAVQCVLEGIKETQTSESTIPGDAFDASMIAMKYLSKEVDNVRGLFNTFI